MVRFSPSTKNWKSILIYSLAFNAQPTLSASLPDSVDVVIVGAGLAGLTAADKLLTGKKSVIVLEARNRVGGKVYNQPLKNGGVTEVGAEFVGPTQDKVLKLISDLGLQTFDTYTQGRSILWQNNTRLVYSPDPLLGGLPPISETALGEVAAAQAQLDTWAAKLDTNRPWSHPDATTWDSQTFARFIDDYTTQPDAKYTLTIASKAIFSAEPKEISLLYVIAYIAAAGNEVTTGNLGRLVAVEGGAQEKRVMGGTGLIPQGLAKKVGSEHIVLNAAVTRVTKTSKGYEVRSRAGSVLAKQVVLAMPPPLLRQITFEPQLPAGRRALNERMVLPAIGKAIPIYKTPFWRTEENLNGQVVSDQGLVRVTFDSTPEDASFGAILGFLLGDEARKVDRMSVEAARKFIQEDYVRYFGKTANEMTEFVLQRWDLEQWSRGGPVAVTPPGVLTQYGTSLRPSAGGIHFAGTETSPYWTGYMDGAIRSGERVAQEILGA